MVSLVSYLLSTFVSLYCSVFVFPILLFRLMLLEHRFTHPAVYTCSRGMLTHSCHLWDRTESDTAKAT